MAAKKKETIANLIPSAITVKGDEGEVVLAGNAAENKILNWLLAAQMRAFLTETIKKYKEDGSTPTPKELRDLVAAGNDLAEFSATVYKEDEKGSPIPVAAEAAVEITDFSKITKPESDPRTSEKPAQISP